MRRVLFITDKNTMSWYRNGLRHNKFGPAREYPNGKKEWWVNGLYYNNYLEYLVALEHIDANK